MICKKPYLSIFCSLQKLNALNLHLFQSIQNSRHHFSTVLLQIRCNTVSCKFYGCIGIKTVFNYSSLDISAGSSDHGNVAYYADKVVNVDGQIGDFFFHKTTLTGYVGNQSELAPYP